MWLDTQDTSSWDWNPPNIRLSIIPLSHQSTYVSSRMIRHYVVAFAYLHFVLLDTRVLNSYEQLCIARVAAVNSLVWVLNIYIYTSGGEMVCKLDSLVPHLSKKCFVNYYIYIYIYIYIYVDAHTHTHIDRHIYIHESWFSSLTNIRWMNKQIKKKKKKDFCALKRKWVYLMYVLIWKTFLRNLMPMFRIDNYH